MEQWPPEDIHVLIPGVRDYVILQRGMKVADGIKVTSPMALQWGSDPGLSGWDEYDHRDSDKWAKDGVRVTSCEKNSIHFAGCEPEGGGGHKPRSAGSLERHGEGTYTEVTEMNVVAALSLARGDPARCLTPRIRGEHIRVV